MNGLCAQLTRVQIVHGVIHLAAPRCHAVGAQFQRLAIVSNRGIGISRNTISNVHSIPLRPCKAVRCIIAATQRFITGSRMLYCQARANGKRTAQGQHTSVGQLIIQRITIAYQRVVSIQRGDKRTGRNINSATADAAAQHTGCQIDSTTCHFYCDISISIQGAAAHINQRQLVPGFAANGIHRGFMTRGDEVGLVIGCSLSRSHTIRAQHKVVYLTMLDGSRAVQRTAVFHQLNAVGTACLEAVTATLGVGHPVVGQVSKLRHIQRPADVKCSLIIKHVEQLVGPTQRVGPAQRSSQ